MNRSIKVLSLVTITGLVGVGSFKFIPQSNASNFFNSQPIVASDRNISSLSNDLQEAQHEAEEHRSITEQDLIAAHTDFHEAEYEAKQHRQIGQQYATLYSYNPKIQINVRSGPGTNYRVRHYGYSGDPIDLLDNSTRGGDGYRWYNVRFVQSGARGWVREDLISFAEH